MSVQYSFTVKGQTPAPLQPVTPQDQAVMLRYFWDSPVTLPQTEKPTVSIIIPVFNQFEYTIACLHSLVNACAGKVPYEVILADDGSTDRTREIAQQVANLRIIRNTSGQHGFLPNVNFASQYARGEYLFLLNNDTLLLENGGLLERLAAHFSDPTVGVVGNRLMDAAGKVHHCVWLFWSDGSFWDVDLPTQLTAEGDAVEGSAFLLRRTLWQDLGGFDPAYGRGYFEEGDLCFKVKTQKQLRVICDTQSRIIHFGQRTFQDQGMTAPAFQFNARIFFGRWHDYLVAREQELPEGSRDTKLRALYAKLYTPNA